MSRLARVTCFLLITYGGLSHAAQAQTRTWYQGSFHVAGGVPADSPDLMDPLYIAANDSAVFAYDMKENSVKAFRRDGRMIWSVGRVGRGPWEFHTVVDLQLDEQNNVWVTDAVNMRLTVLSQSGKKLRMLQVNNTIWSALPYSANTVFARLPSRSQFYHLIDTVGAIVTPIPLPKALAKLDYNQAVQSAAANRAGVVVSALKWGSLFFLIGPDPRVVREYFGVDSVGVAAAVAQRIKINKKTVTGFRIDPKAEPVHYSATIDVDRLYLLGRDRHGGERVIDSYRIRDGAYEGSFRLASEPVQAIRIRDGFVVLIEDPVPRIDFLQWRPN